MRFLFRSFFSCVWFLSVFFFFFFFFFFFCERISNGVLLATLYSPIVVSVRRPTGEYPLNASVTRDQTTHSRSAPWRGALTFSGQGIGIVLAATVTTVLLTTNASFRAIAAITLCFGGVPLMLVLPIRFYKMWEARRSVSSSLPTHSAAER